MTCASIDVPDGFLEEGASCQARALGGLGDGNAKQVSVYFTPQRAERYERDLHIKCALGH